MKNLFNTIKVQKPKKNVFDLTHDVKMSGQMGNLMPMLTMECVPGDKITLGADTLIRFAPLIAPVMHRMDAYIHYFFVPNRILWPNWEKWVVNEPTGGMPYITLDNTILAPENKFLDYMGIPPFPTTDPTAVPTNINALPFAAYQKIYNEYYRDQNLIAEIPYELQDGDNNGNRTNLLSMHIRSYEHDYFTACLPFAQKGNAVDIPLGDVKLKSDWAANSNNPLWVDSANNPIIGPLTPQSQSGTEIDMGGTFPVALDPNDSLEIQATTINSLRRAFKLQEWLEKNARGGTRYIENILMHFGIMSSDKRLQRPEYITGVKSPIVISEVLNTTGENAGLPQGNMAGHAVSVGKGYNGSYYCEEHGYIIGIMSILPKPAYQQGIPKTYLKNDPLDLYWPSFAHIGEQEVINAELYAYRAEQNQTFGYIPRYAEYKYMPPRVAGDFRDSLDYWHLGRIFANTPNLTQEFIECDPADTGRIFAVLPDESTDQLYIHVLNKIKAVRPMPVFGTPML